MVRECKQLLNALDRVGQKTGEIGVAVVDALLDKLPARMYGEVNTFTCNQTGRDPNDLDVSDLLMVLEKFAQLQEDIQEHGRGNTTIRTGQYGNWSQGETDREDTGNEDEESGSEREDRDNEEYEENDSTHNEDSGSDDDEQQGDGDGDGHRETG